MTHTGKLIEVALPLKNSHPKNNSCEVYPSSLLEAAVPVAGSMDFALTSKVASGATGANSSRVRSAVRAGSWSDPSIDSRPP